MRALQQTLQSSRVACSYNMQRMQASRPQCDARQLRRPLSHTKAISLMSASSQRYSVVAKAGGLGGFMQGLAAKLTGARNADDATPSGTPVSRLQCPVPCNTSTATSLPCTTITACDTMLR